MSDAPGAAPVEAEKSFYLGDRVAAASLSDLALLLLSTEPRAGLSSY